MIETREIISSFQLLSQNDQNHCRRVQELSLEIANYISGVNLDILKVSSLYHDIGKILVDNTILNKKSPLSDDEFSQIMLHSKFSGKILHEFDYPEKVIVSVMLHHENYDGTGYPFKLEGKDIPLEARIIRVADVYDALRSKRAYKNPYSIEECKNIMNESKGNFDPEALESLFKIIDYNYIKL